MSEHALVTGATGFIGRWLVPRLTQAGYRVTALVRDASSRATEYAAWVDSHGGDPARVRLVNADLGAEDLALSAEDRASLAEVDLVYHLGAAMQLGLDPAETRAVNEEGTLRVLRLTAESRHRARFVLISGFRMGASGPRDLDRAGAYEASKVRADRRARALAKELGVDVTVVNPAVVIGDSRTGETRLFWGFADLVQELAARKMPAVPGSRRHWMPLVTVDYVADFLARVPPRDAGPLAEYTLLDERTPDLGGLLRVLAGHLGVPAPRLHVPMALVPTLLRLMGQRDKIEGLAFISTDRYDTRSAARAAERVGLALPDLDAALERNVAYLRARVEARPS